MHLSDELKKRYTRETLSAREAQRQAQFIAFGPAIFQTARLMLSYGILDKIRDREMTMQEISDETGLSAYAVKCLMEAALCSGIILVDPDTDRFRLSKTGWFLITDRATRVNINFNQDVNYLGWHDLDASLREGRPAGLHYISDKPTVYEGLSTLDPQIQRSWFEFDHFYSDNSFREALEIVFANCPRTLLDVGGNTGRWALQCVSFDPDVEVTVVDLPQQIEMMRRNTSGQHGAERIRGVGMNLLDRTTRLPSDRNFDAIWMSQFLDCFSEEQIVDILSRAAEVMTAGTYLYIMETLWDRQKFEPAALCLTLTSLYFTAIANGNSKMYHSDDMARLVSEAGLTVETIYDHLGWGHSIMVCRKQ